MATHKIIFIYHRADFNEHIYYPHRMTFYISFSPYNDGGKNDGGKNDGGKNDGGKNYARVDLGPEILMPEIVDDENEESSSIMSLPEKPYLTFIIKKIGDPNDNVAFTTKNPLNFEDLPKTENGFVCVDHFSNYSDAIIVRGIYGQTNSDLSDEDSQQVWFPVSMSILAPM